MTDEIREKTNLYSSYLKMVTIIYSTNLNQKKEKKKVNITSKWKVFISGHELNGNIGKIIGFCTIFYIIPKLVISHDTNAWSVTQNKQKNKQKAPPPPPPKKKKKKKKNPTKNPTLDFFGFALCNNIKSNVIVNVNLSSSFDIYRGFMQED